VLRGGGVFVAADSVGSDDLREFHAGDTYNPINPEGLPGRLEAAGFVQITVRTYDLGWTCSAHTA
jgi:hypothetical protein